MGFNGVNLNRIVDKSKSLQRNTKKHVLYVFDKQPMKRILFDFVGASEARLKGMQKLNPNEADRTGRMPLRKLLISYRFGNDLNKENLKLSMELSTITGSKPPAKYAPTQQIVNKCIKLFLSTDSSHFQQPLNVNNVGAMDIHISFLAKAISCKNTEIALFLIEHSPGTWKEPLDPNIQRVDGSSPLHIAILAGDVAVARALLTNSGDGFKRKLQLNLCLKPSSGGYTPLHLAIQAGTNIFLNSNFQMTNIFNFLCL